MAIYYITGENLRKLNETNNSVEQAEIIYIHIRSDCRFLLNNFTGINEISWDLTLEQLHDHFQYNNNHIICCSDCFYNTHYDWAIEYMRNRNQQIDLEEIERQVRRELGIDPP